MTNIDIAGSSFENNPVVAGVIITRKHKLLTILVNHGQQTLLEFLLLIPPPCPRGLKERVLSVRLRLMTQEMDTAPPGDGYPVLLELDRVDVVDTASTIVVVKINL